MKMCDITYYWIQNVVALDKLRIFLFIKLYNTVQLVSHVFDSIFTKIKNKKNQVTIIITAITIIIIITIIIAWMMIIMSYSTGALK